MLFFWILLVHIECRNFPQKCKGLRISISITKFILPFNSVLALGFIFVSISTMNFSGRDLWITSSSLLTFHMSNFVRERIFTVKSAPSLSNCLSTTTDFKVMSLPCNTNGRCPVWRQYGKASQKSKNHQFLVEGAMQVDLRYLDKKLRL